MDKQTVNRWIGVYMAVGGAVGVLMVGALVIWREYHGLNGLGLLLLLIPHLWAALCGTRLFQQTPYGVRWAPLVLALQVPVIMAWGLSYDWFNGLAVNVYGELAHSALAVNIKLRLGEGAQLYYGADGQAASLGVNLVALACLIILLLQRRSPR